MQHEHSVVSAVKGEGMKVTRQYPLVLLLRQVGDSVMRCELKKVVCCEMERREGAAGKRSSAFGLNFEIFTRKAETRITS